MFSASFAHDVAAIATRKQASFIIVFFIIEVVLNDDDIFYLKERLSN